MGDPGDAGTPVKGGGEDVRVVRAATFGEGTGGPFRGRRQNPARLSIIDKSCRLTRTIIADDGFCLQAIPQDCRRMSKSCRPIGVPIEETWLVAGPYLCSHRVSYS